ncbi:MAG: site-specific integrase [Planctomycetaceae bacterium]|nr:site-specific integrase [Planctomycetaceae bacterium]
MPRKSRKKPAYSHHKPSGQARVRFGGKSYYLGEYGSSESYERYEDLIAKWLALNDDAVRFNLTVDDLVLLFLEHAKQHYRKNGQLTSEYECLRLAFRPLVHQHGTTRVREFSPLKLKEVRELMIDAEYTRKSINKHVERIRRLFRWGVENEFVPDAVHSALCKVSGLQKNRSRAKESTRVTPVDQERVEATLPFLNRQVKTMVKLQLLTGMRPGEVCSIRPCDVEVEKDEVWVFTPSEHKTEHHEKLRKVFIGPKGQDLLRSFLDRDPESFCFSPAEANEEQSKIRRAERKTPLTPSQKKRKRVANPKRTAGAFYTNDSYRRAVVRACEQAFGMPDQLRSISSKMTTEERQKLKQDASAWRAEHCWTPNQLRHLRATWLEEQYGLEAAQVVLGHSDPRVTRIYAERNLKRAAEIMAEVG